MQVGRKLERKRCSFSVRSSLTIGMYIDLLPGFHEGRVWHSSVSLHRERASAADVAMPMSCVLLGLDGAFLFCFASESYYPTMISVTRLCRPSFAICFLEF